jgi:hypothetical protein
MNRRALPSGERHTSSFWQTFLQNTTPALQPFPHCIVTPHRSRASTAVPPATIPREYWGLAPLDLPVLLPPHLRLDVAYVPEGALRDGVSLACAGRLDRLVDDSGRVLAPRLEGVSAYAINFGHEPTYLEASVRATVATGIASDLAPLSLPPVALRRLLLECNR